MTIAYLQDDMFRTFEEFSALNLTIDMTRGKPSSEQLDLCSVALVGALSIAELQQGASVDLRNYGLPLGLPEARRLGAELLGVDSAQVVAAGNSSLELMHDAMLFACLSGVPEHAPWKAGDDIAFICPVPGYDRHFAICEALGIRMIPVPLTGTGPDMDCVEALVAGDPSIKGMWCSPCYSNPTGDIYSADTVRRLAEMPAAASDFRLFWDDAYRFHHLTETPTTTADIVECCRAAGHPARALVFMSFSKVTFAGGAIAFLATSPCNVAWWQQHAQVRSIGPDKVNQYRHVKVIKDAYNLARIMDAHRAILFPKFEAVINTFNRQLSAVSGVSWTEPRGGYFISLYCPPGLATRTVELAASLGIALTPAGAAFPYGRDPQDRHLRIAPSFPSLLEVKLAAEGIALSLLKAIEEHNLEGHKS